VTGDVADLAAKRDEHKPGPRDGEELRRHGILTGYAGRGNPPMRHHYPMTSICECGKTIRRVTPEAEWEHVQW
jgi:hypothetical protein